MSIQATEATWAADVSPPSRKLVLLFMAHKHNGQTGQLNPSVSTVARGCGITACQARRHLHALIEDGFLEVVGNDGGGAPGSTRSYRLTLDRAGTDATPRLDATPSTDAQEGSHPRSRGLAPMHERASTYASQTGMKRNEKEMNRKKTRERASVQQPDGVIDSVWTDFLAIRKAKRSPLTETALRLLMTEASKAGLSLNAALEMCCARGWQSFQADWVAGQQQSAADKFNPTAYVNDPQYRSAWDAKRNGYAGAAAVIFDDADHV